MKMRAVIILFILSGFALTCKISIAQNSNKTTDSITVFKKANPNNKVEYSSINKDATWKKMKNPDYKEKVNKSSETDNINVEKATNRRKRSSKQN